MEMNSHGEIPFLAYFLLSKERVTETHYVHKHKTPLKVDV